MSSGRVAIYLFCILLPVISHAQNRYDILITEFLADPTPSQGLPESEFIELKNLSSKDYNLHNWKISNGAASATIKSDYFLKADSFLILCATSAESTYSKFGPALGVSGFPSLNNDAGEILLSSDAGAVIHAIQYDKSWFENVLKSNGGWSLEMIDLSKPCRSKDNWSASISTTGGTPGQTNSMNAVNPDEQAPSLVRAVTMDSLDLTLLFDEPVDSSSASDKSNYSVSDGIGYPDSVFTLPPFFDRVMVRLPIPLSVGKIYTISLQHIEDCSGNEIGIYNTCKAGVPEKAKTGDIIFNEILFNPPPYGYDYLELFNRSPRIINCSGLFVAGKNMDGSLNDPIALVKEERNFFPGEYFLLTENPDWVLQNYPMSDSARILSFASLPTLPDDVGKVVLLGATGESLDELDYDHHWHSPLLASESGVSLERIRTDLPTSLATNWTSAAASAGYGTPGYKNSESSSDSGDAHFISLEPKIFSPDMDGYHDFCFINYHLPEAGFMGSISIYNTYGSLVRKLVNNTIWATSGTFRWDGLDDQQNLLPLGHYIVYVELFLLDGTIRKQTLVCVLARKR
jgi:Lamin Tail Domain